METTRLGGEDLPQSRSDKKWPTWDWNRVSLCWKKLANKNVEAIHGRNSPLTSTFLNQIPQARPALPSSGQMAIGWLPFPAFPKNASLLLYFPFITNEELETNVLSQCKPCMKYLKYVKEKQEKGQEKDF